MEDDLESQVKAGENDGVILHHVAVVREMLSLGKASSESWTATVPIKLANGERKEKSQAVVFAQDDHGKVVGVATIGLH